MPEFGLSYDGVQVADVDEDGGLVLVEIEAAYRCTRCGETFEEKSEAEDETCHDEDAECSVHDDEEACEDAEHEEECAFPHKVEAEALSWVNAAHISIAPEEDSIKVGISVDDPRGSFQMEIRRSPEDGRIYMHVPYAGMPAPHAPLKYLHEGTYAVNESE